jgi:hypothetical protein
MSQYQWLSSSILLGNSWGHESFPQAVGLGKRPMGLNIGLIRNDYGLRKQLRFPGEKKEVFAMDSNQKNCQKTQFFPQLMFVVETKV